MHSIYAISTEKKKEILLSSVTKAPLPSENSQNQNTTKNSITQQLRTDLGRSIGVTTAIQLVW